VAGAVSGNCGGSIFIGSGNNDARCFRRPKVKRAEPVRGGWCGRGVFSKDTWPPELPSDLDDSEARGTGRPRVVVLSTLSRDSANVSGRFWLVDKRPSSSKRLPWLFLKPSGPLFRSVDLRSMLGRSFMDGSNERRLRVNCCSLPRFLGVVCWSVSCSGSMTVGAVVMIAGAT
jgi:hypothetical protein